MSQLWDFCVCSRPVIDQWADALEEQDEDRLGQIQADMPRFLSLKGVGQDDFNLLAACVQGPHVDSATAVTEVDLVREVSEDGPWIIGFRDRAVSAIAGVKIDQSLIDRWVHAAAEYRGENEMDCRRILTPEVGAKLQDLCSTARKGTHAVFACFYG